MADTVLTSLIGLMTVLTSLMGLSAENYSQCWRSKTLGKRSGEDKVELKMHEMSYGGAEKAEFAFKLELHCRAILQSWWYLYLKAKQLW